MQPERAGLWLNRGAAGGADIQASLTHSGFLHCSFDAVLNLQSAANVATHTRQLLTQHLLLPCRWDFGAGDTNGEE